MTWLDGVWKERSVIDVPDNGANVLAGVKLLVGKHNTHNCFVHTLYLVVTDCETIFCGVGRCSKCGNSFQTLCFGQKYGTRILYKNEYLFLYFEARCSHSVIDST